MDCSLPGSSVHGIFQARVLEWGAIAFSNIYIYIYIYYTYAYIHIHIHGASLVAPWYRICLQCKRPGFNPCVGKISWRRAWQPTLVLLTGEFHGQRSLVGYSPWGHTQLDTSEGTKQQQQTCIYTYMFNHVSAIYFYPFYIFYFM